MDFLTAIQQSYDKLPNMSIVTGLWKEIISGKRIEVASDALIEYSFHYPVDTEVYLEELNQKFEDAMKEDFRTIDGNIKAYLLTFLYYCMVSKDRIPVRTALYSAKLYLNLISLPTDIGKLYFETNLFTSVLMTINNVTKKSTFAEEQVMTVLELIYIYSTEHEVSFTLIQGISNMYANVVKHRAIAGENIKESDTLAKHSLKYLKDLILAKEHPKEIKYVMESMVRVLRSKPCESIQQSQRKMAVNISKKFIKNSLLTNLEQAKLQYFLESLFDICEKSDFDLIEDFIEIINMLDEENYKELLRRIPHYLESKNHESYYINLMRIVYHMLENPHPGNFDKLDVLFQVCFRDILMYILSKKKKIQDVAIDTIAKICMLQNNELVNSIFQLVNVTGKFVTIDSNAVLRAMIRVLDDQKYVGNPTRNKNMLNILSKMLTSLHVVNPDLASKILFLICIDGTPFSVKHLLNSLHELYLKLSDQLDKEVRPAILKIFFKMAMHQDQSSSVFLEHLYNCIVFPSNINGTKYGPECYSNLLLTDDFEYRLLMTKGRHLIKYDHVYHTISTLDYRQQGHCVLLNSLLEFVKYKEYNILTDYIITNYAEICFVEHAGQLISAFQKILVNRETYNAVDLPKFNTIHNLLWDSLFKQLCGIINIKPTFVLIDTLKDILELGDDEEQRVNLLTVASERAYRALTLNQLHAGSIMHLTELCITLRRSPRQELFTIFENVLENTASLQLLQTQCKDTLIQLLAFFGTIGMMNRRRVPVASKLFKMALKIPDPVVQLTAVKMYYTMCTEITHEFEDVIKFCLKNVTTTHPVLSRICVMILEELIHDNYILLNSEDFLRFVHRLGSYSLYDFMRHTLGKRFTLSNKHDIGRFYMTTLVFLSGHNKLENYPVSSLFANELLIIRSLVNIPNDLIKFLFNAIQIKTRFSILREMSSIFDTLVAGKCRVDSEFFTYLNYSLYTFKVMSNKADFNYKENYYGQVCKSIEKQVLNKDPKFKDPSFYGEYEADVRKCTISLLELMFFVKSEDLVQEFVHPVFDTVICWIDHVKPELVQHVHYEKGKEYEHSLKKLVHYYKSNKQKLETYIQNQER